MMGPGVGTQTQTMCLGTYITIEIEFKTKYLVTFMQSNYSAYLYDYGSD